MSEAEKTGVAGGGEEGGEEAGHGEERMAIGGEDKGDEEGGEAVDPRALVEPVYGKPRNR